jgi:hypothetical protein
MLKFSFQEAIIPNLFGATDPSQRFWIPRTPSSLNPSGTTTKIMSWVTFWLNRTQNDWLADSLGTVWGPQLSNTALGCAWSKWPSWDTQEHCQQTLRFLTEQDWLESCTVLHFGEHLFSKSPFPFFAFYTSLTLMCVFFCRSITDRANSAKILNNEHHTHYFLLALRYVRYS